MRAKVTAVCALTFLLLAIGRGHAQAPAPPPQISPPTPQARPARIPGFVPPYEIIRTVRAAGFDPLAPPLREGTTYVLRATDFRGILMRVVVDARTGAIRDANRILPGPGTYGGPYGPGLYGQAAMAPAPYGAPPDAMPPPYGEPPHYDASEPPPDETGALPPPLPPPPFAAAIAHPAPRASVAIPLPRPRPADVASRQPGGAATPAAATDPKPDTKSEVTGPGARRARRASAPAKTALAPSAARRRRPRNRAKRRPL